MKNSRFESLCQMTQSELKSYVTNALKDTHKDITVGNGFVFAAGNFPVCLVAHMDTVHKEVPKQIIYEEGAMRSPQGIGGDDRCGVYMILQIIKKHNCSVLFLEDEEVGCVGATKFVNNDFVIDLEFNYMIELDRRGSEDAVFYNCDNPDFEDFITKDGDWVINFGSCSDISVLAPVIGCAAVNFSCGYYNEHKLEEYVVPSEMEQNINKVCRLLERTTEEDKFEFIEAIYNNMRFFNDGWLNNSYYTGETYIDEDTLYSDYLDKTSETRKKHLYCVSYYSYAKKEVMYSEHMATSKFEALGKFFADHPGMCFDEVMSVDDYGASIYDF